MKCCCGGEKHPFGKPPMTSPPGLLRILERIGHEDTRRSPASLPNRKTPRRVSPWRGESDGTTM